MTLPSRHMIRISGSGGLSTLPLGHGGYPQYLLFTSEQGQRWQCARYVKCAEMATGLYSLCEGEMARE